MGIVKHRNLNVRGTVYPDTASAAKGEGVSQEAVYYAIRNGSLDRLGMGTRGPQPYPVRIGARTYPSVKAASRALGISVPAIYSAIHDGDPDRLVRPKRYNPRPVSAVFGWPVHLAIAWRRLAGIWGLRIASSSRRSCKKGSKRGWERILAAAMKLEAQQCRRDAA